jgi:predicted amidohydrolase YtcJ
MTLHHRASMSIAVIVAAALAAAVTGQSPPAPTLVLVGGRVFTGVASQPWAEAVAIADGRITFVGSAADAKARAGAATSVIDLGGRLVIPGFNDAHWHPEVQPEGTELAGGPDPMEDPSLETVLERLRHAVAKAPPGGWIFGTFGAALLDDPRATRAALDPIAPGHRVMLQCWSGHGTLFNTAALRHLGVAESEPDPPGGFYGRVEGTRTISGLAHEYAEYRLRQRVSLEAPPEAHLEAFRRLGRQAGPLGITSVQAMVTSMPAARASALLAGVDLPIRLRLIDFTMEDPTGWTPRPRADAAGIPGTKWVLDGTPLERLMLMRAPYADRATRGRANLTQDQLRRLLARARAAGHQPMVHAVGDAAIDMVLDALEATGGENWQALRPRLEHGDLLMPDQMARTKRLGVVLVQNPSHLMIPQVMAARVGRDRLARTQALKTTVAAGVPLAIGTDGPLNPFLNLMFAVTHAVNPPEALTREQAILAYTQGAALAEFREREKGTLAPGMAADLAVLSQDIFQVPAEALPATTSILTLVGGRIVHDAR